MHPHPIKVTLTKSNQLDFKGNFFTKGDGDKYVFHFPTADFEERKEDIVSDNKNIKFFPIHTGEKPIEYMLDILRQHHINKLLVEGGSEILTYMLSHKLAHQLRLAIAPVFVGDDKAPRFVKKADFSKILPLTPLKTEILGDTSVIWYELGQ